MSSSSSSAPSVTYSSTRGGQSHLDFGTVVLQGLARDRGLFVPDTIPTLEQGELESWRSMSFPQLTVQILQKFIGDDQVPRADLERIVHTSCDSFRHSDVTPVKMVNGHAVLELFHGPTFAFKDVALQMLGNFFEYFLEKRGQDQLTILGATSGDTGSAAIAGLRGKRNVQCCILFPNGRVSHIQERQMTTIPDSNIHCIAIDGTFDDCQDLVKASFDTPAFRDAVQLGAVNSINWCRVLAQTSYYFWSYLRVTDNDDNTQQQHVEVHYSVPTGNFGDILAGYYSKQMGLPVGKLIVATNENDILYRFFTKGEYYRESIQHTISPSMDICVSSNFERYLFHLLGNDPQKLKQLMVEFEKTHKLHVAGELLRTAQSDFDTARADTNTTLQVIKEYHTKHDYLLCPHSAVGVSAVQQLSLVSTHTVCLATADQGKFPDAVKRAIGTDPPTPPQLQQLMTLPTRRTELPNDLQDVQDFVQSVATHARASRSSQSTKYWWAAAAVVGVIAVVAVTVLPKTKR